MKPSTSIFIILAGLFNLSSLLTAQTITLNEFLNQLKQDHPLFEKELLKVQVEKEEQDSYLGDQDWNILSSANLLHEEPAFAFSGVEKTNAISVNGGVERVFWNTGGRLSASLSIVPDKV